jgi:hypothetical protein
MVFPTKKQAVKKTGSRDRIQIFREKWIVLGLYRDLYGTCFLTFKMSLWELSLLQFSTRSR